MSYIDVNSIVKYFSCPTKLSFNGEDTFFTLGKIKSYIFSGLLDYSFYLKVVNQPVSLVKLNQRLNYLWSKTKKESTISTSLHDKIYIKNKLYEFTSLFESVSSTIYYDVPRVISLGELNLSYSFFSYLKNNEIESVVKFYPENNQINEKDISLRIISSLVEEDLSDLDDGLDHKILLFNSKNGNILSPKSIEKVKTHSIYRGLEKNLTQKYFLPRNNESMCRECSFKQNCEWNSLDG